MEESDKVDFSKIIETPWPEKGDQLFMAADDWWHNACLNTAVADWDRYAMGYKFAGDVLVEHVTDKHRDQDFLVYPAVFLYRQYLELRLKWLIMETQSLFNVPAKLPPIHQLDHLWRECRPLLERLKAKSQDLDIVGALITEFGNVDPSSEAFRYPVRKTGELALPADLRYINLRNLAEVMDKIGSLLEGTTSMVMEYLSSINET